MKGSLLLHYSKAPLERADGESAVRIKAEQVNYSWFRVTDTDISHFGGGTQGVRTEGNVADAFKNLND